MEYEGALYHVTGRGNERGSIFRDERDRIKFLELLALVVGRERWVLHAYCLMGNHYHLLLETPLGKLSRGMQVLNGRYTQAFNLRHRRRGHLFEGRFKAILVEKEAHLLELCRYVVLNPVRAGMVRSAGDWAWSNYRVTSGRSSSPKWLEVDWTLSQFGRGRSAARRSYGSFVSEGRGQPSPWKGLSGQVYLGGRDFLAKVDARLKGWRHSDAIPLAQRRPFPADPDAVRRAVAGEFGVEEEKLSRRRGGADKRIAVYLTRKMTALSPDEIGRRYGIHPSRVSHIASEVERSLTPALRRQIARIEARVSGRVAG